MSTSVHYKGVLANVLSQGRLLEFLRGYALSRGWKYTDVDDEQAKLKGILLEPSSEIELTPFLFDPEGHLHSFADLICPGDSLPQKYWIASVKTHYAGVEEHIAFINLLRQIKEQFFPNMQVTDESDYWTHADVAKVRTYFDRMDGYLGSFKKRLENDVAPVCGEDENGLLENILRAAEMAKREVDSKQ
ncbi:MAG: hypothetical protein WCJ02_10250 [bacterium]